MAVRGFCAYLLGNGGVLTVELEIWSDIMCPFCYMGKRRLEKALREFVHRDELTMVWRSYQLDPELQSAPGVSIHKYLAQRKGMTRDWSVRMHAQLEKSAAELGLSYDFDKVVVANSFDAHRLAHFARTRGLQDQMQERLFAAYFCEGRDMGDRETLVGLASDVGLDPSETRSMLAGSLFADDVRRECEEAEALGAGGVPFFVIDRRYGFTGAQPSELILEFLTKAWSSQVEKETPPR
jgi:predicted DsbA family dithiol-disulfide isomerase